MKERREPFPLRKRIAEFLPATVLFLVFCYFLAGSFTWTVATAAGGALVSQAFLMVGYVIAYQFVVWLTQAPEYSPIEHRPSYLAAVLLGAVVVAFGQMWVQKRTDKIVECLEERAIANPYLPTHEVSSVVRMCTTLRDG